MLAEKIKELEEENVRLKEKLANLGVAAEQTKNCEYCANFIQHYVCINGHYIPICQGHCIAGNRIKDRKRTDTCKSFVKKDFGKNFI